MNNCKYCGGNNPSTVFKCLKCSAVMPAPPPVQAVTVIQERKPVIRKQNANLPKPLPTETETFKTFSIYMGIALAVVGLFVGMFFVLNKIQPLPQTGTFKPASSITTTPTIKSSGGILLATTEQNFDEMMKAANANDDAYLQRMGVDGKLFRLDDGTKIRIIDGGMFKSKVSATEGRQAGRAGWLPNELISQ